MGNIVCTKCGARFFGKGSEFGPVGSRTVFHESQIEGSICNLHGHTMSDLAFRDEYDGKFNDEPWTGTRIRVNIQHLMDKGKLKLFDFHAAIMESFERRDAILAKPIYNNTIAQEHMSKVTDSRIYSNHTMMLQMAYQYQSLERLRVRLSNLKSALDPKHKAVYKAHKELTEAKAPYQEGSPICEGDLQRADWDKDTCDREEYHRNKMSHVDSRNFDKQIILDEIKTHGLDIKTKKAG